MKTRVCRRCKRPEHEVEFPPNGGMCRVCKREYERERLLVRGEEYLAKKRAWKRGLRRRNALWIVGFLREHPCVDCGQDDPELLEFDHVRGTKKASIADMVSDTQSLSAIQAEIDKCEVRCVVCHRKKTAKQFGWFLWV